MLKWFVQTSQDVIDDLGKIFDLLAKANTNPWKAVITLSPQRYAWIPSLNMKNKGENIEIAQSGYEQVDNSVYNNGDKAILRVAIDEFIQKNSKYDVTYFPAF